MPEEEITFDENDRNLFEVDDPRLRADALKHSVLPRMHALINIVLKLVYEIYAIDVFDDSIISQYPNFRERRERELTLLYDAAFIGLGGKRVKKKWWGLEREDRKEVQILPFRLGLYLSKEGIQLFMHNNWVPGISYSSYLKFLYFHIDNEALTHRLCYLCKMRPRLYSGNKVKPISTFKQHYRYMANEGYFANDYYSPYPIAFPISPKATHLLVRSFALFYPIYDSYIQISKGEPVRFLKLINKANVWLAEEVNKEKRSEREVEPLSRESLAHARNAAEQRVKVMPAMRWQVLQRDNWKCLACGRTSEDDVILHVDHIVPRSKGGADTLANYQTLCNICNLGKSNKDDTDLRRGRK